MLLVVSQGHEMGTPISMDAYHTQRRRHLPISRVPCARVEDVLSLSWLT
jgi:hypothetical protein